MKAGGLGLNRTETLARRLIVDESGMNCWSQVDGNNDILSDRCDIPRDDGVSVSGVGIPWYNDDAGGSSLSV